MSKYEHVNNAMKAGTDIYVIPCGLLDSAAVALDAFCRPVSGGGLDNSLLRFHAEAGRTTHTRLTSSKRFTNLNLDGTVILIGVSTFHMILNTSIDVL